MRKEERKHFFDLPVDSLFDSSSLSLQVVLQSEIIFFLSSLFFLPTLSPFGGLSKVRETEEKERERERGERNGRGGKKEK